MRPAIPANDADLVGDLNLLMAEEAEACCRYFQIRFRLRGRGRLTAARFFKDALEETLEHAEALAHQIKSLGQVPHLRIDLSLNGGPISVDEALAEALDIEQQALDAYQEFLPRTAGHGMLEEFIRAQVALETIHVQEILKMLAARTSLRLVASSTS